MPKSDDHRPQNEVETFRLSVEVPREIRHNPIRLRQWLEALSADDARTPRASPSTRTRTTSLPVVRRGVKVVLNIRPCGPRMPADDEDDDCDDDDGDVHGPPDEPLERGWVTCASRRYNVVLERDELTWVHNGLSGQVVAVPTDEWAGVPGVPRRRPLP